MTAILPVTGRCAFLFAIDRRNRKTTGDQKSRGALRARDQLGSIVHYRTQYDIGVGRVYLVRGQKRESFGALSTSLPNGLDSRRSHSVVGAWDA